MKTTRSKKRGITKGERILYCGIAAMLFLVMFIQIYSAASLGNLKMNIEKLNYQISSQ